MLVPAPHVRMVLIGDSLVALDVLADRYSAIPGALTREPGRGCELWPGAGAQVEREAAEMLVDEGLLVEAGAEPAMLSAPRRALKHEPDETTVADLLCLVAALGVLAWRLARGRHCRSFEPSAAPAVAADDLLYVRALSSLSKLRLFVPTPRRCLPAAMLAGVFLKLRGLPSEIVYGVRSHPFEAHCWLQTGGVVLDDDLDCVAAYAPIAIGQL